MDLLPIEGCAQCPLTLFCLGGDYIWFGACDVCHQRGTFILPRVSVSQTRVYRAHHFEEGMRPACESARGPSRPHVCCPKCWSSAVLRGVKALNYP